MTLLLRPLSGSALKIIIITVDPTGTLSEKKSILTYLALTGHL